MAVVRSRLCSVHDRLAAVLDIDRQDLRAAGPLVESKRQGGRKALQILDRELLSRPFLAGTRYTIADMSVYAYSHLAEDAGISPADYPHYRQWVTRVRAQPGFLSTEYPYSIDPHAVRELP